MSLEVWFWLVLFLWFLGGAYERLSTTAPPKWVGVGLGVLPFLAVLILGIHAFGAIVK